MLLSFLCVCVCVLSLNTCLTISVFTVLMFSSHKDRFSLFSHGVKETKCRLLMLNAVVSDVFSNRLYRWWTRQPHYLHLLSPTVNWCISSPQKHSDTRLSGSHWKNNHLCEKLIEWFLIIKQFWEKRSRRCESWRKVPSCWLFAFLFLSLKASWQDVLSSLTGSWYLIRTSDLLAVALKHRGKVLLPVV